MSESEITWRQLYFSMLEYHPRAYLRQNLYEAILCPGLESASKLALLLKPFRSMADIPINEETLLFGLWDLYALSRISDFLLLSFQSTSPNDWRDKPSVSPQEYVDSFHRIGFESFTPACEQPFSPFHHEVFEVEQSSDAHSPMIVEKSVWPGLRFGELLFSRAGVRVRAGSKWMVKQIAETSTLYFANRRLHRQTEDLSMGWGSNSQWRTSLRLDYATRGRLYYNIEGKNQLWLGTKEPDRDNLTPGERLELCKNRCFIRTAKPHDDLWPYDDRYEEDVTDIV